MNITRILIYAILINIICSGYCVAQKWESIGIEHTPTSFAYYICLYGDTVSDCLLIGGDHILAEGTIFSGIASWDGTNFSRLNGNTGDLAYSFPGDLAARVKCITRYKGEVYAGGHFHVAGTEEANNIARWDGANWNTLGNGLISSVNCLLVKDDNLYVGGAGLDSIIGSLEDCNGVVMWDGVNWHALPPIPEPDDLVIVSDLIEYKGELYAGGNFGNWNDSIQEIAKWDGTQWVSVGGGIHGDSWVDAMAVYKGYLYVGGYFYKNHGNAGNFIMRWDGEQWSDVGGGLVGENSYNNGQVHGMYVYNNELWIAGVFTKAGGIPAKYIAKWDGDKWCNMETGFANRVRFFGELNNELYVGGGFQWIDTTNIYYIAKWTGGSYVDTCSTPDGVFEIEREEKCIVFPNPATSTLCIKTDQKIETYRIYNIAGQFIAGGEYDSGIPIANLKPGLYILSVDMDGIFVNLKFIKKE